MPQAPTALPRMHALASVLTGFFSPWINGWQLTTTDDTLFTAGIDRLKERSFATEGFVHFKEKITFFPSVFFLYASVNK